MPARRVLALSLMLLMCVAAKRKPTTDVSQVYFEVQALNTLYELELTPEQLAALKGMASGSTTPQALQVPGKLAAAYSAALDDLRDALASNDDDKIGDAQEKVDQIEDDHDLKTPDPQITPAARQHAAAAMKLLTAPQLANYIANHSDEVGSPLNVLNEAVAEVHGQSEADAAQIRASTSQELVSLLAGVDENKARSIEEQVRHLLSKARTLSDTDFQSQKPELERQAKQIVGPVDAVEVLRNWCGYQIAELLANPQLSAAIEARQQAPPAADSKGEIK